MSDQKFKDLRGYKCPMNYVHVRLMLSEMAADAELEVWVDDGEPAESVPLSLRRDGFMVKQLTPFEGGVAIKVQNTVLKSA